MIIDTHCHILPGVDDGAKNADETRKMLRMAFKDGIDEIIATPHFNCDMDASVLEKGWGPICVPVNTLRK
ncbi:MAG: CpsB/CapC family capsule biosynthesis tyrosine phosphatase [Blautia marasmi]